MIEPGEYAFQVKSFERGRYPGGAKIPACNMATLSILILDNDGNMVGLINKHNLILHTKCEFFVSAFFRSIGSRKHGEKMKMDWSQVVGSRGRCVIASKTMDSKKNPGEKVSFNEIKKFLDPVDVPFDGQF
jgi:hypothetical protein